MQKKAMEIKLGFSKGVDYKITLGWGYGWVWLEV
jgi:hypothetical protein